MVRMPLGGVARPLSKAVSSSRAQRRCFSAEAASHPSNKTQVYVSKSRDPFLNLSLEHRLLQSTPPDSTILFLYTNAPCVVFGRNQNPWLEVNLPRLAETKNNSSKSPWNDLPVKLVRRRSGGGTVFHDEGNVNFSVICPPSSFDRNKHAEMVVRALKQLGRPSTRVNERHDIVIDTVRDDRPATFKVSGSAYKLTRLRSLHHGTCLLKSPNLSSISGMLRSGAEGFIKARGVDSVRSPVTNLDLQNADFEAAVLDEFGKMYGKFDVQGVIDETVLDDAKVKDGYKELQSRDWIWGQTPRFTFSTHPYTEDTRERPALPFDAQVRFEARHGTMEKFEVTSAQHGIEATNLTHFTDKKLYDISDWHDQLQEAGLPSEPAQSIGLWLNDVMGTEFSRP